MRILFLSQLVPYPADAGPKVRSLHVLEYLASAGHDITLVAFSRDTDTTQSIDHLGTFCSNVYTVPIKRSTFQDIKFLIKSIIQRSPFLIARDYDQNMFDLLRTLVKETPFDAIHADQLWMAPYALAAKKCSQTKVKMVLDQHNAVYLVPERMGQNSSNPIKKMILDAEGEKLSEYEISVCAQFDHVVWVTDEDRMALRRIPNGQADLITGPTIPICVDPDAKKVVKRAENSKRVTFLGGLHWPPNAEGMVWFYKNVWPQIVEQVPDAKLTVIGKNPPSELMNGNHQDSLEVTGFIDDPVPYLEETAAFIVPLHSGGGMRVKIIDGWSWGLPIISTTIGAEGIKYSPDNDIIISDTPEEFAKNTIALLTDTDKANTLAAEGRRTVEENFDWQKTYKAWDQIYG